MCHLKISLVMPSYNQGAYLQEAIESVLSQNYPNLEFLMFDGGSTDNSRQIIESYSSALTYWQSQKDGGQAAALKAGFEMATGDILCWLNSDDILLPGAFARVVAHFRQFPKSDFVYGDRRVINACGGVVGEHRWPRYLTSYHWALGQPMAQECCFWRRELYRKVGGVNADIYFVMDYDLFVRMWKVGRFRKINAFLGCLREHDQAKSTRDRKIWERELNEARGRHNLKKPGYIMSRIINRFDRLQTFFDRNRRSR